MIKILVIGNNGFIGRHCFDYFTHNGYDVWGCDVSSNESGLKHLTIDSTNTNYDNVFKVYQFDVCINCSGAANVPNSLIDPISDFTLNTVNVFKMLNAIKNNNPSCKFINLSSAAVYGNPTSLPIEENHELNPMSPYGFHKMQAEEICKEFYHFFKIKTCSLRIFSAYGSGLQKQLLWDLSKKMDSNSSSIELFGTGEESRDFIYITDLVRCIDLVIKETSFNGEVINVANGIQIRIKEIATLFANLYSWNGVIYFKGDNREGDPINWMADIKQLTSYGYVPQVMIEDGIRKYISWLKEKK